MNDHLLVANSDDGTITTLRRDGDTLTPLATSPVGEGCNTFAIDAEDRVYAAVKGEPGFVVTLHLDRESGALTEMSRRPVDGVPAYLALAAHDTMLLSASYGGGHARVWPIDDGVLGKPRTRVSHANAHCILPVSGFVYIAALGDDVVAQYHLGDDGVLQPLEPPQVATPTGSGPRHLVVDGANAYLVTEFSAEAIRFDVATDGTLTPAEAVRFDDPDANLPHSDIDAEPPTDRVRWGADVHLAGPWLLCSERTASTIATIRRDSDGRLGEVVAITPVEEQPRGFVVAPDGRSLVVVGERSDHASLLRVEDDGRLTLLDRVAVGAKPNWVRFV